MKSLVAALKSGVIVCLLWGLASASLFAQTTGTITGQVTDPSGSVVPNTTVEVQNAGTGLVRTGTTDSLGSFVIPGLPVGVYKLTAKVTGFKTFSRTGITLAVGESARADVKLELGTATETVE